MQLTKWVHAPIWISKGQSHSLTLDQGHSDSTFLNFFSWETSRPIEAKFHVDPPWHGGITVYSNGPGHMKCCCIETELLSKCYCRETELLSECCCIETELLSECYCIETELLLECYCIETELLSECCCIETELISECCCIETALF